MQSVRTKTKLRKYFIYIKPNIHRDFKKLFKMNFSNVDNVMLVTNEHILDIYRDVINRLLEDTGCKHTIIALKDGEQYKSLESAEYLYSKLNELNYHKNDVIIAFGGGVTGDLAGFVAATYHRGIRFIQYPTSIIAQIDASGGGKVGVNYKKIKNIIGSFYQPHMVLIDPLIVNTLEENYVIGGLSEMLKYGIIFDDKIIKKIDENLGTEDEDRLYKFLKSDAFNWLTYKCTLIKRKVIETDEFDKGYRHLLNFGHTVGHCIENVSNLKINHGIGVSMGMVIALDLSIELGLLDPSVKDKIMGLYKKLKMPDKIPGLSVDKIFESMDHDKKFTANTNSFILIKGIKKPLLYENIEKDLIKKIILKNLE